MKFFPFLVLFFVLFAGCASKKERISAPTKPLPSWYTHPPRSDASTLYEVGEGVDRHAAVTDALNLMAAGLSVTIASEYRSTATEKRRDDYAISEFSSQNDIRADVEKIRITNYSILEATEQSFRKYLVLVKAEKSDLAKGMKNDIDATFRSLESGEKALRDADALRRYFFYRDAVKEIKSVQASLRVVRLLDTAFDPTPYLDAQRDYEQRLTHLKQHIAFELSAHSSFADTLVPVVREGIAGENLFTGKKSNASLYRVEIKTSKEYATSMGVFLARTAIALQTADPSGTVVGTRTLHLIGQSSQSYAIAEANVAIKLKNVIKKEGILAVLGLDGRQP